MYLNRKHVLLFVCSLLIVSCKSKKLAQDIRLEENTPESALQILQNHNLDYEWFSAKAKLKYADPYDSESGTAYIRIKKDSTIWMTLKKFSVEGFRLSMNPDSLVILNRLEKTYSITYWEELSRKYETNLNYAKVQNWLVGNVALPQNSNELIRYLNTRLKIKEEEKLSSNLTIVEKKTTFVILENIPSHYLTTNNYFFVSKFQI